MAACNITYSNPPASAEVVGEKIRTPEQVLKEQLATCLDASVLPVACLEQAGLHPLVVTVQGHAFPGVWLEDHLRASRPVRTASGPAMASSSQGTGPL